MKKSTLIATIMTLMVGIPSLAFSVASTSQDFVDLTEEQMHIDSVMPEVSHYFPMPKGYQDSLYNIRLLYPEYTPLTKEQVKQYAKVNGTEHAPSSPVIEQSFINNRKAVEMRISFMPVVEHEGKLCFISSYLPRLASEAKSEAMAKGAMTGEEGTLPEATATTGTYASSSVLASGRWAKIAVSTTGICKLTPEVIAKAGFNDISKVKIYGYGGGLVPEKLTQEWLAEHDDLQEVPACLVGNAKYFYAYGTVTWSGNTATKRTRNPYSNYGCYFITEGAGVPKSCTEADLIKRQETETSAYHYLLENEQFSYSKIGRELVDGNEIAVGKSSTYEVLIPASNSTANIQVAIASGTHGASYRITIGTSSSSGTFSFANYDHQKFYTRTLNVSDLSKYVKADGMVHYPVTVTALSTGPVRLDYISAYFSVPAKASSLAAGNYPAARYLHNITNQNHHADKPVDMIVIIPASLKLYNAAHTLAEYHRTHDGMSYRIVPADELYNEFSSGTPDVSAYKRYLKMFYDKAQDETQMPKTVLLFGDAVWDNRMNSLPSSFVPEDYLLSFQTENSVTYLLSIAADDFITVLKDNKNIHVDSNETKDRDVQFDIAIGRIPVVTAAEAMGVVNKMIRYMSSSPSGSWQNEIVFIGDDGDANSHMSNINKCADLVIRNSPGYNVKKVMADAYEIKATSTGKRYPEITTMLKKQQKEGALVMNYGGHASWTELSHEQLFVLSDFMSFKGDNYSLWFTAACETVPFDQTFNTIGESAVLNTQGGAIAFYGTVRTVTETNNSKMNIAFMKHVLSYDADGKPLTLGEAQRRAKNDLVRGGTDAGTDYTINKHNYVLIGDPAMSLALPRNIAVVDSINGKSTEDVDTVMGNSVVTIKGHIRNRDNELVKNFNGTATILVRDSKKTMKCRNNEQERVVFTYDDRISNLYKGSCQVVNGEFTAKFRIPRDIYDDGKNGLITVYAMDNIHKVSANGECEAFSAQGWEDVNNDNLGPSIYCYLNNEKFQNGAAVGRTPFFVAQIKDKDGINATGSSLGHNMELIIDGDASKTYSLDDNFVFDYGSYTSGQTYCVLKPLAPGAHTLQFKAWDLLNNSNTLNLSFVVQKGMQPDLMEVSVNPNPIKGVGTFYIYHDMRGSNATVKIEIFSPSGKMMEEIEWDDTFSEKSEITTYKWVPNGLSPGLYLYRVRILNDGAESVSMTKKLIIAQ